MLSSEITNTTSGRQVVDMTALLGRCLGNFKMVERVLATLRGSGKSDLDQLQSAIESRDYQAAADL
ncbi:MAG: hypothetical protein EXS05_19470, partial [Planctomycetaceae bacterium]|nr:hypothetical protein [Planctomycetaceae bacterium]